MTSTRAINAAAGVIHAAMQQGKTLPQTIAYALDSAGLLNSPEIAAELEHLRKRVAELEAAASPGPCRNESPYGRRCDQPSGHDGDHGMADGAGGHFGWPASDDVHPESLHASSGAVIETTTEPSVDPNGCGRCGIPQRKHGRQWTLTAGWHPWNPPTDEQIKERMLRRRSVNELRALLAGQREDTHDSELHHTYRIPRDFPEARP